MPLPRPPAKRQQKDLTFFFKRSRPNVDGPQAQETEDANAVEGQTGVHQEEQQCTNTKGGDPGIEGPSQGRETEEENEVEGQGQTGEDQEETETLEAVEVRDTEDGQEPGKETAYETAQQDATASCSTDATPGLYHTKPYQPNAQCIEKQILPNKSLSFQDKWFQAYPWLHYSPPLKGVLCFFCSQSKSQTSLGHRTDPAFVSAGFRNWRKANEKFMAHQQSQAHCHFVSIGVNTNPPISVQLSKAWGKQQEVARHCFKKVVSSVRHVARQGQALRGHTDQNSNFSQLLKLRAEEDDPILLQWLTERDTTYTSPQAQNEILQLMANTVVRDIATEIKSCPNRPIHYSIIVDGTQDRSGDEQESICLRFVDHDLVPHEDFVGLYNVSETTGKAIAQMVMDVLLRLNLPISGLRGQTFDGAANMSGAYSGAQAILKQQQPLALYVHCAAHCVNLITEAGCLASSVIRDCMAWVHQLGVLFGQSGKFKTIFKSIAVSEDAPVTVTAIKPLCPTRWTVRNSAILSVLSQYERVLSSLKEMAEKTSKTATTASGLYTQFSRGKTVLGLTLASVVVGELECLNIALQKKNQTVSGMMAAVDCVRSSLQAKRTDETYLELYEKATAMIDSIESVDSIGRQSRHVSGNAVDFYRVEFFKVLDCVDVQFEKRFQQDSLSVLSKLENMLLTGDLNDCVDNYPELNRASLSVELPMFHHKHSYKSSAEAAEILRELPVEMRGLFTQVEILIRLLLVVPVSSCEAERSFSALRRLKTWLRSTMSQSRLNSVIVCHVHQERLDELSVPQICQDFVGCKDNRRHTFGAFV